MTYTDQNDIPEAVDQQPREVSETVTVQDSTLARIIRWMFGPR